MSVQAKVLNLKGEEVGTVELPADVFGAKPSRHFLHEAVTAYLNNERAWTAHTKTRAEVSGGGRKPWVQKHTGRARAGSIRSPLWRKGGTTFGPRFVDPALKRMALPRKKARLALVQALSARAADGGLKIIDSMPLEGAKTKPVAQALRRLGAEGKTLIVVDQRDANLAAASRNIAGCRVMLASHLNAREILAARGIVVTRAALEKIRPRRD